MNTEQSKDLKPEVDAKTDEQKTEEKKEVATVKTSPPPVEAKQSGQLMGTTLDEQYRLAVAFQKSGMLPKQYTTPEKVLVGMQFAYELGLKPLMALRQISVINGQPSLWGELPLALVRRSGQLESINEMWVDKDYKEICFENKNLDVPVWCAVCEVKRTGKDKKTYTFSQKDKHTLGVQAIWNQFEKTMMMRKARGAALKAQFADILEGMLIAEYDFHVIPEEGSDMTVLDSQGQKLQEFKDKFKKNDGEAN